MLDNLKINLVKIAKGSEKYDLCREKTGSFSIRDESSGYILITPSKIKIEELSEEAISIIDLNGNKIKVLEGIEPSNDLDMHLEIYKERKDIRTIMHVHPLYTATFAVINKVIPPITYDAANYGGYIYIANYNKSKATESAKDLIEKLKLSDACLLESNGAIVISREIEDALSKARAIERVAETYYKSLTLNGFKEPKRFTREELMEYLKNQ